MKLDVDGNANSSSFSGVIALTLTPALCAILLKNTHGQERKKTLVNRFIDAFNRQYNKIAVRYRRILEVIVNRRAVTVISLLIFCIIKSFIFVVFTAKCSDNR